MTDEDKKKSKDNFEEIAKKRIKVGLILNEFGEQNQIKVSEQELQAEVQKQIRMRYILDRLDCMYKALPGDILLLRMLVLALKIWSGCVLKPGM